MQKATPKKDFRFVFLAGLFFTALSVYAAINLPWGPDEKQANGFLVMAGTSKDVTVYSECKKVTAPTGKNVYVPTKSLSEWTQFKVGASNVGATLGPCGGVVNGVCSTPPAFCSAGTKIADNNNTIPGQNRLWICQGSGGGVDSLQCSYTNPASAPVCGNGVIEAGENCDNGGANSNSTPGACKTDCSGTVPNPSCTPNGSYSYSSCSVSCGGGTQDRYDSCGAFAGSISCNTQACSCVPNGSYTYGACSASCGGGVQEKHDSCNNVVGMVSCNTQPCPIDGGWSGWSGWGACSATACGTSGTQTRYRTCDNPAPANGGANCSGSSTDSQTCSAAACTPICAWVPIGGGPCGDLMAEPLAGFPDCDSGNVGSIEVQDWIPAGGSCGGGKQKLQRVECRCN